MENKPNKPNKYSLYRVFANKESASPIVILTGFADVLPSEIMLSVNNIKQYKTNVLLIFIFLIVYLQRNYSLFILEIKKSDYIVLI